MTNNNDTHGQRYSEDEKRQILKFLESHTYKETCSHFNISEPTLARWRQALSAHVDQTKAKIIITLPQFWLDYLNDCIKESIWDNYDEALVFLLKKFQQDRKAQYLTKADESGESMLARLQAQFDGFLQQNPEIEAIIVFTQDLIKYQSPKWPSPDIKPLISWWKHFGARRRKGIFSVEFNGSKYIATRCNEEQIVYIKAKSPSESTQNKEGEPTEAACYSENYICGVRLRLIDHSWYFFALVSGKPPCHVQTAHLNFERVIHNLMPVSEADIIKPFTDREQLKRKIKATTGQKNGNGNRNKAEELAEMKEAQEEVPVLDIENLVIEKLAAKIGQPIPFNSYTSKMPPICFYSVQGHVTKLRIRNANLTCIPDLIKELTFLELLDLENNHITAIPECMGALVELEELNLSGNDLQSLPAIFDKLDKLSRLYLDRNKFTEFPLNICKLKALRELSITKNQIVILPVEVHRMPMLYSIDITQNLIQALDKEFDHINYGGPVVAWRDQSKK